MVNSLTLLSKSTRTMRGRSDLYGLFVILLAFFLTWFLASQVGRANADVIEIAYNSIPSVDAAQVMMMDLQVYDATQADWLSAAALADVHPCTLPPDYSHSVGMLSYHDCDSLKLPILQSLIYAQVRHAIQNITFAGEATALEHTQVGLTQYFQASYAMQQNYTSAVKAGLGVVHHQFLVQAYIDYTDSEYVLKHRIALTPYDFPEKEETLPVCHVPGTNTTLSAAAWTQGSLQTSISCLEGINYDFLQAGYSDTISFLSQSSLLTAGLSLGFVFILLVGFARVVGMSKRPSVYSLLLVAGLLFAGIGCYSGYSTLSYLEGQHGAFHRLVIDDRVSIDALARAAYTSTDANADESRFLIAANYNDTAAMQEWGDDFKQNRKQVEYENSVEGGNITYHPLEDQYYAGMVKYWNLYTTIDGQIRHAIAISNPNDPHRVLPAQTISLGISNDAFAKYQYYVQADWNLNHDDYVRTLGTIQSVLQRSMVIVIAGLLLSGICTLIGRLLFGRKKL